MSERIASRDIREKYAIRTSLASSNFDAGHRRRFKRIIACKACNYTLL
ncbi:MAG: hypothetical protein ACTSWN_02775 [Promethearchaeota archaeon]